MHSGVAVLSAFFKPVFQGWQTDPRPGIASHLYISTKCHLQRPTPHSHCPSLTLLHWQEWNWQNNSPPSQTVHQSKGQHNSTTLVPIWTLHPAERCSSHLEIALPTYPQPTTVHHCHSGEKLIGEASRVHRTCTSQLPAVSPVPSKNCIHRN